MSAIGAIGSYGSISGYDSFYRNRDRGPFGTEPVSPVSRAQTAPVPPVSAVPAVRRGTAQPVPEEQESAFPFPTLREGADPAEMAVRARIQYLDGEAEDLERELVGWDQSKGMEKLLGRGRGPGGLEAVQDLEGPVSGEEAKSPQEVMEDAECQTCKERKYQDGSDDPGVSFKTPTNVAPEQAAAAVRGHEQEHVVREQAKALREDRKVVSQSVTLHTDICPECGDVYISGGTTRTTTKADPPVEQAQEKAEPSFQAVA